MCYYADDVENAFTAQYQSKKGEKYGNYWTMVAKKKTLKRKEAHKV